ncbi:MAG: amylo-alpha-1,6-glucosidase [Actinomycetota bacterium]|nr:amylo-alpha-1,6-glucosidase [Actinomycetota bacterium]
MSGDGRSGRNLTVLDGSTFFISDPSGDVEAVNADGFFHADMRHLSTWRLLVDGESPRTLSSEIVDYYSARVVAGVWEEDATDATISVTRERFVAGGVHEDLIVENLTERPQRIEVVLEFACDFGDILECHERPAKKGRVTRHAGEQEVTLRYKRGDFVRETAVRFGEECAVDRDRATFVVDLAAREVWRTCVDVVPIVDGEERPSRHACGDFGKPAPYMPVSLEEWLGTAPQLETDWVSLRKTYDCSLLDLAALRFQPLAGNERTLPAGGLPWFMTLFGRDSILMAYQLLPFQPDVAKSTLEVLASLQATERDDFRDAEPGKILHELRCGELTILGDQPHSPYYGGHDTTSLFLVLLDEYQRWTGDSELVRSLEQPARAALRWIEEDGDLDDDGFLEYSTRSAEGLANQGWKDSDNSMLFADGTRAELPIATCEVQAYCYDALRRTARLAREVWDDAELADRLLDRAEALREHFEDAFWSDERGHYVLALDGEKRQVDSLTSNIGHVLWSGIASPKHARATVEKLMSPELASGWGIRTMSSEDTGYNPLEYHNGTVWPHDTALVAEGMRRYGFREEASRVAVALLEAAEAFDGRLPELFAGFERADRGAPVEYDGASRPQSFAAGAPLMALRTLLGLDAENGALSVAPAVPKSLGPLALRGVGVHGREVDAG